jgi:hypothetical protein
MNTKHDAAFSHHAFVVYDLCRGVIFKWMTHAFRLLPPDRVQVSRARKRITLSIEHVSVCVGLCAVTCALSACKRSWNFDTARVLHTSRLARERLHTVLCASSPAMRICKGFSLARV